MKYLGIFLLSCSMFSAVVCLEAGEQKSGSMTDQMRGSVNRLKSFGNESLVKQYAPNPEREKELKRMLPNFHVAKKGTSSRDVRAAAETSLRRTQLTKSGRQTTNKILDNMSLFRRLPELYFEADAETYDYFVGHPDVVVSLWQAMGISEMKLQQTGPHQYKMVNTDGTTCEMFYLRKSKTSNIIYCKGNFKSPVLKNPIAAQCILNLHTKFEKQKNGTVFIRHSADVFISFPNAAIEAAAKLISPVSNYIADRNFQEISLFMHTISLTMARQPSWLQQMADQMQGVHPDRSLELKNIILENYKTSQKRLAVRYEEYNNSLRR